MSISGIQSNRGDGYQTLVAFDWALTVLTAPDYHWLEIDSIRYSVDDVVISKSDGNLIACQCKKNQSNYRAWSISDLAEELEKASSFLEKHQNAEVRFYSRNNFGDLARLREYCTTQNDEDNYRANLGKELKKIDEALSSHLSKRAPNLTTYKFLLRTKFVTSDELARMEEILQERLRNIATSTKDGYYALWTHLDQLGARMDGDNTSGIQHRLSKENLKAILNKAGAMFAPPMNIAELRATFADTSTIGRSWRKDIGGVHISNRVVTELLRAIAAKKRSILLTGLPGSGKTCVMLALQEALEQRAQSDTNIAPLFIQSREFSELATAQDRQAQGLPKDWVEKTARLAENAQVTVIIDSLDVLSIARDHSVLTYFLAQIDRLLLIPNVSVVTACRDFDRHYDRRIAERKWDCELKCQALDWETEVSPLLEKFKISTSSIDSITRTLICNPRELALFVELAQRGGSFNVVTSQALAQRYLDTIVRANAALGDEAMRSIEAIALNMLNLRSLAVPHQHFIGSQEVLRVLCSLNVLQESKDGRLAFGHQTLLDVLVISGALRRHLTLNQFLDSLPPVPFIRPSIRSFVTQLARGERREFRRQVRTVLTGNVAFHIRRLVAESFAERTPQDEDWSLIYDLYENHRDVFQIIYDAKAIEWHYFWMKYLVPKLKLAKDPDGMARHVFRVSQWVNQDTSSVVAFWMEALSFDWLDGKEISRKIAFYLSDLEPDNNALIIPLLKELINLPSNEHSFLGKAIAHCVKTGAADDVLLWRYITGLVSSDDVIAYRLNGKLNCNAYEFGEINDRFIHQRMEQSTVLLDLALDTIECWSNIRSAQYGETRIGYRHGFLGESSYQNAHSQGNLRHMDSLNILLDAVESAIVSHAKKNSTWWRSNRIRLCSALEGALIYFAILACTASPNNNADLIEQLLCNKDLLIFELEFELGSLIQSAFIFLEPASQDAISSSILDMYTEKNFGETRSFSILKRQAELISTIPCFQRSSAAQAKVDEYERKAGALIRKPHISLRGGVVSAPFSYEVFLNSSNNSALKLLSHYAGYRNNFDDFLVGGEEQVGWQLQEASSRHPRRFLSFLPLYWVDIPEKFRDCIMDGVATFLDYRYGNLQINGQWEPIEEPNASELAELILDELDRHTLYWHHRRSTAKALRACANVINDSVNAERLVFLAIGFRDLQERDPITGSNIDLINLGINMPKGNVADALMIIAENFHERDGECLELLEPTLLCFAGDEHPAVRSQILRRLPYLQSRSFEMGWNLFHTAMQHPDGLWKIAEPCLYYAYYNQFEVVKPLLDQLQIKGVGEDLETWGRISALTALSGQIDFTEFLDTLKSLDKTEAWHGASTVWSNFENVQQHHDQCFSGLHEGLNSIATHSAIVAKQMDHFFYDQSGVISVPTELIRRFFEVLRDNNDQGNRHLDAFGFLEWLNATSQRSPVEALAATEIYLDYISNCKQHIHDHKNGLTQLMTRLFSEAEEKEESDEGSMLRRVVAVQDKLLTLGIDSIERWLRAAERP